MSAQGPMFANAKAFTHWRALFPGLVLLATLLILFRDTATAMVSVWARSETFTHAFLVPPIVLWLAWRRRQALAALTPRSSPWVLLPVAAVCGLWLLGELAAVNAATQFALVTLIVLTVPALFGPAVTRVLLFPLLFLYFSVPIGEFLTPLFMIWTADFTVLALQWSGVPVYREGLQFVIPSGNWSVVEACSGVRYLIASLMVGTIFAYLNYQSLRRRLIFVAVAILVPIVANWLRAYMIVMIGHLSGNTLAVGVDHLLYGWVFFGIVIMLMFMIGARWAEPEPAHAAAPVGAAGMGLARQADRGASGWRVVVGMVVLLAGTQAAMWQLDRQQTGGEPLLALPAALGPTWQASDGPLSTWEPAFRNPSASTVRTYQAGERRVSVWVGYYRDQNHERKLISSLNALVGDEKLGWSQVAAGSQRVVLPGGALPLRSAELRGTSHLHAAHAQRLRVWQVYWIDGRYTASDARGKLMVAFNRLLGRGSDGAAVVLTTELDGESDQRLGEFARDNFNAISVWLGSVRAAR